MSYNEYTRSFETEIGRIDIVYMGPEETQVWVNGSRVLMPSHVLKQTTTTIVRKVCALYKSAALTGVRIGGVR
jgi:hypothetical protein